MNGLDAENLIGDQIAIWPEEAISPDLEAWIVQHKAELIAELRESRRSTLTPWHVYCDGKPLATMLSPCQTPEEALSSARARWPRKHLTIKPWTEKRQPPATQTKHDARGTHHEH